MKIRSYTELSKFKTFEDRFEYLRLDGAVGFNTFGSDRFFNQQFYRHNPKWKTSRREVIIRDNGCDLGVDGYEIYGQRIIVHHMNPITMEDIEQDSDILYDPEYLITTVHPTHNAIHYGDSGLLIREPIIRTKNDTCPWKH